MDDVPHRAEVFEEWHRALWERHGADLTFPEIRKGLQAVSRIYVEERDRLTGGKVFDGRGKRAAFALFYGPLHFRLIANVFAEVGGDAKQPSRILDLGCGSGVGGAAWALAFATPPPLSGCDTSEWAVGEAQRTYRDLGLTARVQRQSVEATSLTPAAGLGVVCAYSVNELDDARRERLWKNFAAALDGGAQLLIVEPIAKTPVPWWDDWAARFHKRGGRADEWRFAVDMPSDWRKLAKAAGLDYRELSCRSLWCDGAD